MCTTSIEQDVTERFDAADQHMVIARLEAITRQGGVITVVKETGGVLIVSYRQKVEATGISAAIRELGVSEQDMLDDMRHMLGMTGRHKPYRRNGKYYFKPWRNYWDGDNAGLEYLSGIGLVDKTVMDHHPYYSLTRTGMEWLGERLNVTIHTPR